MCLDDPYLMAGGKRSWSYPLPEFGCIHVPHCIVFRNSEQHGYELLPQPQSMPMIVCASYSNPPVEKDPKTNETVISGAAFIKNVKRKISCIFETAVQRHYHTLVLSAFGCGAYGKPPKHMAQLMREVLLQNDGYFQGKFKHIVFAIFDDHNSFKEMNPEGNVKPFAQVFCNSEKAQVFEEWKLNQLS